jgi:hypothetical protein
MKLLLKAPRGRPLAILVGLELVSAALAMRDLANRTDEQVRGNKLLWRVFISMNPGNSIAYWLAGRR